MKPSSFEETFTLWLDGQLTPAEAEAFEKEMRAQGFDPDAERAESQMMRALLKANSDVPAIPHADFFSRQLLHRIEQDTRAAAPARTRSGFWRWLTLPRMALAGAASLAVAMALYKTMIPTGSHGPADSSPYFATVVDSRTFDPSVSASTVYNPRDNVTVLWIDGLDYLPADYALQ